MLPSSPCVGVTRLGFAPSSKVKLWRVVIVWAEATSAVAINTNVRAKNFFHPLPRSRSASIALASELNWFRPVDRPVLTTLSKLRIGNGLVWISDGMVGILLNSCFPRENSNDLHLTLGFVLREQ